ncbi:hypothetical protein QUB56_10240 [Microcoleus sp. AR_TQ3_B6]|uniref:hypothetical protein n=1 Tax=Microcoleus sp. AR_TQ3_B6 TaxID=3055284 RepID=UPI002FD76E2E
MKFQIPLTPGVVTQFLLRVVAFVVVLSSLSDITKHFFPDARFAKRLVAVFNLNEEMNIPTFYSCLALLFSAILLGTIAYAKNLDSSPYKQHWKILSFIFLYLSLDEVCQLHERLTEPMRSLVNGTGFLFYTWVVPVGFIVVIFLLSYTKFLFHLPVSTRKLFVAACAIYIAGSIGAEVVGGYLASTTGSNPLLYAIAATLEESLEMLGIVVFIHALISYIKTYVGGVSWNIYIPGKNQQVTELQNIGIPALHEPAHTNLLR